VSAPLPPRRPRFLFWFLIALVCLVVAALILQGDGSTLFGMKREEFAQVGYLAILLVFVGSALLGRNLGVGEIVRATAGWLGILLILVGAYAYRQELSVVGGRLLGVLAPGVPISGRLAGESDADSVVIIRAMDGHFGVRARIEDVPMMLLVDTGASFVTLTTTDAARIGVDTASLRFTLPIRTANGMIQTAPITIGKLDVGSIERHDVPALVAPSASLDQSLLGMSFLNTLHGYAISGDRLVLTPK
jgi:aspartyl protease family protein